MQRYLFVWVINHWQNFPDQSIQDFFTFSRISKHWHIQREIVVNCKLSPLTVDPFPTSQLAMPLERESPELCTCHMSKCALNFYHTFLAHFNLCLFQYVIVCTLGEKMTPFSVSSLFPSSFTLFLLLPAGSRESPTVPIWDPSSHPADWLVKISIFIRP